MTKKQDWWGGSGSKGDQSSIVGNEGVRNLFWPVGAHRANGVKERKISRKRRKEIDWMSGTQPMEGGWN